MNRLTTALAAAASAAILAAPGDAQAAYRSIGVEACHFSDPGNGAPRLWTCPIPSGDTFYAPNLASSTGRLWINFQMMWFSTNRANTVVAKVCRRNQAGYTIDCTEQSGGFWSGYSYQFGVYSPTVFSAGAANIWDTYYMTFTEYATHTTFTFSGLSGYGMQY
jgi:hypothetical protein